MNWPLLILAGLSIYLIRDALLLSQVGPQVGASRLYAVAATAVFCALGIAAERLSSGEAFALLADPRIWIPSAALHLIQWLAMLDRRLLGRASPAVLLALPAPVWLFSAGGVVWLVLRSWSSLDGWLTGMLIGFTWSLLVWCLRSLLPRSPQRAREFAAGANLTALLLLPMQQQAGTASLPQGGDIDWLSSALPLAAVALGILASFLYHRYRSLRRAAHP